MDRTWESFYADRSPALRLVDQGPAEPAATAAGLDAAGTGGAVMVEDPPAGPSAGVDPMGRSWPRAKRVVIKTQLLLFRRCYSASMQQGVLIDTLDDLTHVTFAVPVKSWALRKAARRTRSTGRLWRITKWVDA